VLRFARWESQLMVVGQFGFSLRLTPCRSRGDARIRVLADSVARLDWRVGMLIGIQLLVVRYHSFRARSGAAHRIALVGSVLVQPCQDHFTNRTSR
jgi:hypothetical protein